MNVCNEVKPNRVSVLIQRFREKGVKQKDIARQLDLLPTAVAEWKRQGSIPAKQYFELNAIAKDLKIEIDPELFSWAKQK